MMMMSMMCLDAWPGPGHDNLLCDTHMFQKGFGPGMGCCVLLSLYIYICVYIYSGSRTIFGVGDDLKWLSSIVFFLILSKLRFH